MVAKHEIDPRKPLLADTVHYSIDITNNNKESVETTGLFLYFVVFVVNLSFVTLGIVVVWISPASAKLRCTDPLENPLGRPISTIELAVLASLIQVGLCIGALLLRGFFDMFGRLGFIIVVNFLLAIFLVTLALVSTIILYYVIIFFIGVLIGSLSVGVPIYISEITQNHNRAKISCIMAIFAPIGSLCSYSLGTFLSLKTATLVSSVPSFTLVILSFLFLPESPTFLLVKGNVESAVLAVKSLVSCDFNTAIRLTKNTEMILSQTTKNNGIDIKSVWCDRASRNGLTTSLVLIVLFSTNIPVLMSYLGIILEAANTESSVGISTVIVGLIQIMSFVTASNLMDKVGRRPLLLISLVTSCILLIIMGLYFFLRSNGAFLEDFKWLPFVCIISLTATLATGLSSVTFTYINEVFTYNVRTIALSLIHFTSGITSFLSVFTFPLIMESIGIAWNFWICCIICFFGFLFVFYRIPETKGKDLLEIQEILGNGYSSI
ncbi:facilitated trehalose transporter Tret1-like [Diorhabda sublineata]|uniref:facilitated trehalose transporter Tret1-like n=1 Tax=Diorhabda sublineata TaxID=1163346 RepID=UPI0024E195E0|nr:facilitated trehalose transporter Tret1-like [Diorhabda sublineata]